MTYDVKLLLNIAARFESASTYVIRAGDAAMGNERDNIGEALRIARGAIDDLAAHVERVTQDTPLIEDAPPTLQSYTMQVQTALIREGANSGLDTADTAVVVVGSIKGVGPGDCAAQIIANRHDAAVVPGYTSKGARLLQSVTMRKGREP